LLKSKSILSIVLVSILAISSMATMIPKISSGAGGTINFDYSVPAGFGAPYSNGIWYKLPAAPSWTGPVMPPVTGIPCNATTGEVLVKVPTEVQATPTGQSSPSGPWWRQDGLDLGTGVTKIDGPIGEGAYAPGTGPTYPTIMYKLKDDPANPGQAVQKYARAGPAIDVFRGTVIRSPDSQLIAMQTGTGDVLTDLIRTGDVEKLTRDGFTVTYDAGFHMGHVGFNVRPLAEQHKADLSPRRPDTTIWPLADVNFRHALIHAYDQDTIVASIYGYTVTPIQSLVPPAQGGWVNPNVPKHPYNPGSPLATTIYNPANGAYEDSCSILRYGGYHFENIAPSTVGPEDYWTKGGVPMPQMTFWTPTYETAPTSAEHGARWVTDLGKIGLQGSTSNGNSGIIHTPAEFADYMDKVDAAQFDLYMVFWSLGRFPDHLYDMCDSSQRAGPEPLNKGLGNKPGINNAALDIQVEIIKTSLDHTAKLNAAYLAQSMLYNPTVSDAAFSYMQLYSRIYFNGFNKDLLGVVKSPGYGSDNGWTYNNLYWKPGSAGEASHTLGDGRKFVNWIWGEYPEKMNPAYSTTVYAWDVISKTLDGLLDINPYTHEDLTAMSSALPDIVSTTTGMEITYHLRKDVFWQDGNPFTANDAKFNWEFIKYNKIPRYMTVWQYLDHVEVIDDYTVKVVLNTKSQFLVYDFAGLAAYFPPPVWRPLNNTGLSNILAYEPTLNMTKPTGAGAWFGTDQGAKTQLYGTGSFVFDSYDKINGIIQLHQFPGYYRTTSDIQAQMVDMFHKIGDVSSQTQGVGYSDGIVWSDDRGQMGLRFGRNEYLDPTLYKAYVDVNLDHWIDVIDLSLANFHFGEQRTYPTP